MPCGPCNSDGNSPPSGFTPSGPQSGNQSSYGGNVAIANGNCRPSCPTPPTSSQIGRTPYCPPWGPTLFGSYVGKIVILVSGCLNYLRSGASGWVRYDAPTETVTIDNAPPFVSNVPTGNNFGYLAKTVPTVTQVYDESTNTCQQIGTQEVSSQVLDQRADGSLAIANSPLPGEVSGCQSADADNQVRLDYLNPAVAEAQGSVSNDIGVLVQIPYNRTVGNQTFVSKLWMRLRQFTFRQSQIGSFPASSYPTGLTAVWVPAAGGTTDDPAFTLQMGTTAPPGSGTLPANASNGDTVIWNGAAGVNNPNLPANAWVPYPRGLATFLLDAPSVIETGRTTAGSVTYTLPNPPAPNFNGPIGVIIGWKISQASGSLFEAAYGSQVIAYIQGAAEILQGQTIVQLPATTPLNFTVLFTKVGSGDVSCDLSVIGWLL